MAFALPASAEPATRFAAWAPVAASVMLASAQIVASVFFMFCDRYFFAVAWAIAVRIDVYNLARLAGGP
jgi:hypothetical protein